MHTIRCSGRLLGGVSDQGGVCLGVSALNGCLSKGCLPRGVSTRQPREQNDWQTGVKTLPCRNYVSTFLNIYRSEGISLVAVWYIYFLAPKKQTAYFDGQF